MAFHKILLALHLLLAWRYATAGTTEMDTIIMQLRATVDTDNDTLLSEVLSRTTRFFDDYFESFYHQTQSENFFSNTAFSINSFGIHGVDGMYITTLELDGLLVLNSDSSPPLDFVNSLLMNAFQGVNLDTYAYTLKSSSSCEFLKELTHIIVEIDSEIVADKNLTEITVEAVVPENRYDWINSDWVEIAFYAACGVGGAALCVILMSLCRCCWGSGSSDEDEETPMITRKLPAKKPPQRSESKGSKRQQRSSSCYDKNLAQDTYSRDRSPSPVRSISSQDSSKFTYNPSVVFKVQRNTERLSNIEVHTADEGDKNWEHSHVISPITPAPFGHDISAIDDCNDESFRDKTFDDHSKNTFSNSMSPLEIRNSRSRKRSSQGMKNVISDQILKQPSSETYEDSTDESVSLGLASSTSSSDVINDLKKLSQQINKHRRSTRVG